MALIHAFLSITVRVNQIVSGLALTIFAGAIGLSSYVGQVWASKDNHGLHGINRIDIFGLSDVPFLGPIVFHQDPLVYLSWALVIAVAYYLYRTRTGLYLRAVGESPRSADAMGIDVTRYRYVHTLLGGALAEGLRVLHAGDRTDLDRRADGRRRLDRDLAFVIFAFWRPDLLPDRSLPVRRPLEPGVHAAGVRGPDADGVLLVAAVPDDDRRACRRIDDAREATHRHAGRRPRSRPVLVAVRDRCRG